MRSNKKIVFLHFPYFFSECEAYRRPELRGKDFVVVTGEEERSMVMESSSKNSRISKGMLVRELRKSFPKTELILADLRYYREITYKILDDLEMFSPFAECASFGNIYTDLSGTENLWGRPLDSALRILSSLTHKYFLTVKAGIGSNKHIAYFAGRLAPIDGVVDIRADAEVTFSKGVGVALIPGITPEGKYRITRDYNIRTIGELSEFSESEIRTIFGKESEQILECLKNRSPRTVVKSRREKVIASEVSVSIHDFESIKQVFLLQLSDLAEQLRRENAFPHSFELDIRYGDDRRVNIKKKMKNPSFVVRHLYEELKPHLLEISNRRVVIRTIYLEFSKLSPPAYQLSAFVDVEKEYRLAHAKDYLKAQFGEKAVLHGFEAM